MNDMLYFNVSRLLCGFGSLNGYSSKQINNPFLSEEVGSTSVNR